MNNKDRFRTLKDLMLPDTGDRNLSVSFFASKTAPTLASGAAGWSDRIIRIAIPTTEPSDGAAKSETVRGGGKPPVLCSPR